MSTKPDNQGAVNASAVTGAVAMATYWTLAGTVLATVGTAVALTALTAGAAVATLLPYGVYKGIRRYQKKKAVVV